MVYWGSATVLSLVLLMGERPEVAGRQSGSTLFTGLFFGCRRWPHYRFVTADRA